MKTEFLDKRLERLELLNVLRDLDFEEGRELAEIKRIKQLIIDSVSGSAFIAKADHENILVLVDDKCKVFEKLREIGKTWKSIAIDKIDKVV